MIIIKKYKPDNRLNVPYAATVKERKTAVGGFVFLYSYGPKRFDFLQNTHPSTVVCSSVMVPCGCPTQQCFELNASISKLTDLLRFSRCDVYHLG